MEGSINWLARDLSEPPAILAHLQELPIQVSLGRVVGYLDIYLGFSKSSHYARKPELLKIRLLSTLLSHGLLE